MRIPTSQLVNFPGGGLILAIMLIRERIKYPPLEVLCRKCGQWHPCSYGRDQDGWKTDLLLGYHCVNEPDKSYLCGVAGKAIDGNLIRKKKGHN